MIKRTDQGVVAGFTPSFSPIRGTLSSHFHLVPWISHTYILAHFHEFVLRALEKVFSSFVKLFSDHLSVNVTRIWRCQNRNKCSKVFFLSIFTFIFKHITFLIIQNLYFRNMSSSCSEKEMYSKQRNKCTSDGHSSDWLLQQNDMSRILSLQMTKKNLQI